MAVLGDINLTTCLIFFAEFSVTALQMLGGNIRGYTRTMTTAIALETSKGEFSLGVALGIILMSTALVINIFLSLLQQR